MAIQEKERYYNNLHQLWEAEKYMFLGNSVEPKTFKYIPEGADDYEDVVVYTDDGNERAMQVGIKYMKMYNTAGVKHWERPRGVTTISVLLTGAGAGGIGIQTPVIPNNSSAQYKTVVVSAGGSGGNSMFIPNIKLTNRGAGLEDINQIFFGVGKGGLGYTSRTDAQIVGLNNSNDRDTFLDNTITPLFNNYNHNIRCEGGRYSSDGIKNFPLKQDVVNFPQSTVNHGGGSIGYQNYTYYNMQKDWSGGNYSNKIWNQYLPFYYDYVKVIRNFQSDIMYVYRDSNSDSTYNIILQIALGVETPFTNAFGQGGGSFYGNGGKCGTTHPYTTRQLEYYPLPAGDGIPNGTGGGGVVSPYVSTYWFNASRKVDLLKKSLEAKGGNGADGAVLIYEYK